MDGYNVVLVTPDMFDEAVEILYRCFVTDFVTNYYLTYVNSSKAEYVRRELIVQQMIQYINSPRMVAFALVNSKNKILAVSVWSFPLRSALLKNAKTELGPHYYKYGFFRYYLIRFLLGSKTLHILNIMNQQMSYVEQELLNIGDKDVYKLMLLGTDPQMQRQGIAKSLILTIIDQIEYQDKKFVYESGKRMNNCDYDESDISLPIILLHATNSSYYSKHLGFKVFATVYIKNDEIDELQKRYPRENIRKLNNKTYMTISIMLRNRQPIKDLIVVP